MGQQKNTEAALKYIIEYIFDLCEHSTEYNEILQEISDITGEASGKEISQDEPIWDDEVLHQLVSQLQTTKRPPLED